MSVIFCGWRKFWMSPRQVQILQQCLNKVPLVPLSSNLINANSSLVCCLIFSEIMIEILLVLFFPPAPVTLCKFIPCCMHVNSFFISFFKYSIHYWPMFPFPHLGNWLTRRFLPFSKGKEREHWPEMGFNIWVVWLLCSLGFFFFHPERYDFNEISGSVILERVSFQSR